MLTLALDDGIAEVVQVIGLGAFAHSGFLGFDEVADVGAFADAALGAEVRIGAQDRVVGDFGGVENAAVADEDVVTNDGILNDGVGADARVGANARVTKELDVWLDDCVGTDIDFGVDDAGIGEEDGDAICHEAAGSRAAHSGVEVHHLSDSVGS